MLPRIATLHCHVGVQHLQCDILQEQSLLSLTQKGRQSGLELNLHAREERLIWVTIIKKVSNYTICSGCASDLLTRTLKPSDMYSISVSWIVD